MSKRFKIVGSQPVAGRQPGETVSEEALAGLNVEALIRGRAIAPIADKGTKKEQTPKEGTD